MQSQGEMSQIKHYDAYNQETNRNTPHDGVIAAIRTLHEIYPPAFQAAIEKAGCASIMCAYSAVNGPFSCGSRYLLTEVLRNEWNFAGFNTSDYGATHSVNDAVAGTDMEQPENSFFGDPMQTAVTSGAIARSVFNTMVTRILTEMFRFNIIDHPPTGTTSATVTTPAHGCRHLRRRPLGDAAAQRPLHAPALMPGRWPSSARRRLRRPPTAAAEARPSSRLTR